MRTSKFKELKYKKIFFKYMHSNYYFEKENTFCMHFLKLTYINNYRILEKYRIFKIVISLHL